MGRRWLQRWHILPWQGRMTYSVVDAMCRNSIMFGPKTYLHKETGASINRGTLNGWIWMVNNLMEHPWHVFFFWMIWGNYPDSRTPQIASHWKKSWRIPFWDDHVSGRLAQHRRCFGCNFSVTFQGLRHEAYNLIDNSMGAIRLVAIEWFPFFLRFTKGIG